MADGSPVVDTLNLGDITLSWLNGGEFELDGGTMFGAVPKVLWQTKWPANELNYIRLLNAPILVRTPQANLLIDTGLGNKLSSKQKSVYRVVREWSLVSDLQRHGLTREDIDMVILTHGDFDHAGGVVMRSGRDGMELTFPKARHIIQAIEWEDIVHPNLRSIHAYWQENFRGLEESGLLELVTGTCEPTPGIQVQLTGGHTRGHQMVLIHGSEGQAVHLGDLLPSHCHINPLWIMAYDNFPLEVVELKQKLLLQFGRQGAWFLLYHDPHMKAFKLDEAGRNVSERFQDQC